MNRLRTGLIVAGMGMLGFSIPVLADNGREENEPPHAHENVTMEQLPQAARNAIQKETSGQQIKEIHKEVENGKTVYEAEFMQNGREVEIRVGEDGKLLEHEGLKKHRESKEHGK